jgi:hypothetical protein
MAGHHLWGGQPPQHIFIYFFGFFFFFRIFFCFLRKNVMGAFGNNKAKWVELPQFETLGGVKCHFLNFGGKSENRWILQGGKMYFSHNLIELKELKNICLFSLVGK